MSYQVVAPLVLARDKERHVHHIYQGGVIDWLDDEQRVHFVSTGLVVDLGRSGAEVEVGPDEPDDDSAKPPASAKKDVLVAWIVANVAKDDETDYTADELDELTKAQLQEIIDAVED